MDKIIKRFREILTFELPLIPLLIFGLILGAIWRSNSTAAICATFLVTLLQKEEFFDKILAAFKKAPNPADEQKLRSVVEALNKAHANDKNFDERVQKLEGELGKVTLRLAIKPVENDQG